MRFQFSPPPKFRRHFCRFLVFGHRHYGNWLCTESPEHVGWARRPPALLYAMGQPARLCHGLAFMAARFSPPPIILAVRPADGWGFQLHHSLQHFPTVAARLYSSARETTAGCGAVLGSPALAGGFTVTAAQSLLLGCHELIVACARIPQDCNRRLILLVGVMQYYFGPKKHARQFRPCPGHTMGSSPFPSLRLW